jgi:hypothetical protein
MRIREFVWPQDRIDPIAQHGLTPEEVEQMCPGRPLVQRATAIGRWVFREFCLHAERFGRVARR